MFNLKGKTAIVTGASRGIGQSIAIELARAGANVVVSDIISGKATINKIKKLKKKTIFIKADISKEDDVKNLINQTIKKFKKLDILVNNAGIFNPKPTAKKSSEEFMKTIKVNLKGTYMCCRAAIPKMKKGSSIINISSIAGIGGYPTAADYCSSKGGVRLLTKSLAAEYGSKRIRINSVHPGIIKTKMVAGILADKKTKEGSLAKTPLGRFGQPKDIAQPVVFLASDAASYITGAELVIDGGWTASL